jgi:dTDP-4-amino-4,6-dideoxygalactose transaminase
MRKMGKVQACLAALQWQELGKIASACEAHAREIRRELQDLRIPAPGAPASGEVSVTPRVSFLVTDRQAASAYFRARGIELGQWFDGPLSPAPASPLFNFQAGRYPQAEKVAKSVVNLPCHCSLAAVDLARILVTLSEFVRDRPYCVERSG